MKILLLGRSGQVGAALAPLLRRFGPVFAPTHAEVDLARPDSVRDAVRACSPSLIVNAAAYTAVDRAESEPELARAVNAEALGVLAREASRYDALLVHYSTDYVFDGTKSAPYVEDDAPAPLGVYGQTKLAGEQAVLASDCRHLIFRTSWVYAATGRNFLLTMLRLAREQPRLRVVDDQRGAPTSARAIARGTVQALGLCAGRQRAGWRLSHDGRRADQLAWIRLRDSRARRPGHAGGSDPDFGLSHACAPAAEFAAGQRQARRALRRAPARLGSRSGRNPEGTGRGVRRNLERRQPRAVPRR